MTQTAGRISVNCGERMRRRREQLGASCTFEGAAKKACWPCQHSHSESMCWYSGQACLSFCRLQTFPHIGELLVLTQMVTSKVNLFWNLNSWQCELRTAQIIRNYWKTSSLCNGQGQLNLALSKFAVVRQLGMTGIVSTSFAGRAAFLHFLPATLLGSGSGIVLVPCGTVMRTCSTFSLSLYIYIVIHSYDLYILLCIFTMFDLLQLQSEPWQDHDTGNTFRLAVDAPGASPVIPEASIIGHWCFIIDNGSKSTNRSSQSKSIFINPQTKRSHGDIEQSLWIWPDCEQWAHVFTLTGKLSGTVWQCR